MTKKKFLPDVKIKFDLQQEQKEYPCGAFKTCNECPRNDTCKSCDFVSIPKKKFIGIRGI